MSYSWGGRAYRLLRRTWTSASGVVRNKPDPSATYDAQTIEVMRRVLRRDSNCLDIGAAWGGLLRPMVKIASEGHHHAFEPLPQFAAVLRTDFPRVTVHELALGEHNSQVEFCHVVNHPAYSGLRRRPYPETQEEVEALQVPMRRLDDVLGPDQRVDFVKIDVEGGECGVILGGLKCLERNRPFVVFEYGGENFIPAYGSTDDMLFRALAGIGLCISTLSQWLSSGPPLDRDQFPRQNDDGSWNWMYVAHPAESKLPS